MTPDAMIESRLAALPPLSCGNHSESDGEFCAMEAAAYVAGEPWSDHPECVSPVIAAFLRNWNDNLPNKERDGLLRPLIPAVLNTRGSPEAERRRITMAADWLIRVHTPDWLRLAQLDTQAAALEALPEIADYAQSLLIMPLLKGVLIDAHAAEAAAWDAAGAAAVAAAVAAIRASCWNTAGRAALDAISGDAWGVAAEAAWAIAPVAVWSAAIAVAGDAAGDALKQTLIAVQASAQHLVRRMAQVV